MHGFGPVAHGRRAQRQILDQAQDPHPVFRRHRINAFEVLLHDRADFRIAQIFLRRHGHHQAAGNIFGQPGDLVREPGHVLLADIGQQQIDQVGSRRGRRSFGRAGDAGRIERLVQMDHFDQFVFQVGCFGRAVIVGRQRRRADQHVTHADLAAAVALAMIAGKPFHQRAAEFHFAAHEHVFPGDEQIVEHHQGFMAAELLVADVDVAAFEFAGITGLAAVDVEDAFGVGRGHKRHGIVHILFRHADGRHDQDPVGIERAGLMTFCAADHDAVRSFLDHMHEQVRVGLLVGSQTPVALGIGHGTVHCPVFLLHPAQKLVEALMIGCAQFLVHFEGHAVHGVDRVHPDAALEAGAGFLAEQALHFYFFDQVVGALVKMAEPVDFFAGEMGRRRHQVFIFRQFRQLVGSLDGIHRRANDRVIDGILHPFPLQVDFEVHLAQAFFILGSGHHGHGYSSLSRVSGILNRSVFSVTALRLPNQVIHSHPKKSCPCCRARKIHCNRRTKKPRNGSSPWFFLHYFPFNG